MNGALLEAFRHNSWATRQLLAFCRDLSEEQLAASATGTYGSIRATSNHLVLSDGRYLRRLAGDAPAWVDGPDDADLDELSARAEEAGQLGVRVGDWADLGTNRGPLMTGGHRWICAVVAGDGILPRGARRGVLRVWWRVP